MQGSVKAVIGAAAEESLRDVKREIPRVGPMTALKVIADLPFRTLTEP
jgi:hypothetical protein